MAKIFICYRREDSKGPAQWIYNNLVDHFGSESVVFDVDTIPLGTDFRKYLNKEVNKCDILLAVIGDQWKEILKQRLDEPNDFVRIEIQAALYREIPVVPILVGSTPMSSEKDLPQELAGLSYVQLKRYPGMMCKNSSKSSMKGKAPISTVCQPKPNGNMPAVRERPLSFHLETMKDSPENMLGLGKILTIKRIRQGLKSPIVGIFTICTATCMKWWRMTGTEITMRLLLMSELGF
jgi:hypothetical protein